MKHVFVETNFLISLLRPFPAQDALDLFARNDGVNLRLYIPWCSQAEARRTLTDIIKADLGFTDMMMQFVRPSSSRNSCRCSMSADSRSASE